MDAKIVPALQSHAILMAPKVRKADREELKAAANLEPLEAIICSMRESPNNSGTLIINNDIACIFGCSYRGNIGVPWMVGTSLLLANSKTFMGLSHEWVAKMRTGVDYLENYVDARNTVAIRWLKRLGFKFDAAAPYGPFNLPFYRFTMEGVPECA